MKKRGNRHGQKDGRRAAEKECLPHRMNVAVFYWAVPIMEGAISFQTSTPLDAVFLLVRRLSNCSSSTKFSQPVSQCVFVHLLQVAVFMILVDGEGGFPHRVAELHDVILSLLRLFRV